MLCYGIAWHGMVLRLVWYCLVWLWYISTLRCDAAQGGVEMLLIQSPGSIV